MVIYPPSPISLGKREGLLPLTGDLGPNQNTHLPPVVVLPLGLLGDDAGPEPQGPVDVQRPQRLLVPERHAHRLQGLPLTETEEDVESAARRSPGGLGVPAEAPGGQPGRTPPPQDPRREAALNEVTVNCIVAS